MASYWSVALPPNLSSILRAPRWYSSWWVSRSNEGGMWNGEEAVRDKLRAMTGRGGRGVRIGGDEGGILCVSSVHSVYLPDASSKDREEREPPLLSSPPPPSLRVPPNSLSPHLSQPPDRAPPPLFLARFYRPPAHPHPSQPHPTPFLSNMLINGYRSFWTLSRPPLAIMH